MATERIWLDGVAYVKEKAATRNDKRMLANDGVIYCNICGGTSKVNLSGRRDVLRSGVSNDVEPYMITGHQNCVDLYQLRV